MTDQAVDGHLVPHLPPHVRRIAPAAGRVREYRLHLRRDSAVGGDWFWVDRLPWTWQQWYDWLTQPGVETWVAWVRGTPAGYAELHAQPAGQVELTSFGLLPSFTGQGLGGHLLTFALDQAWAITHRWPGQPPTTRVWLHTCSLDSPSALPTYQSNGLRVYRTQTQTVHLPAEPVGPWPGARRR